jgi:curved DNA-binding protein CbpA
MDFNKDYYKILGVLDNAEDIVIKAAYRALAQKYHPDKNQTKAAKDRMQEINEAYAVLSDPNDRKKYDGSRKKQEYEEDNSRDTKDLLKSLDKKWNEALEYFPDLEDLTDELTKYSKQLEYTFKVMLIEGKEFKMRFEISERLKKAFLTKYFGGNSEIHSFANDLFNNQDFVSLKKLNKAVNLLGSDINPNVIIEKIDSERPGDKKDKKYTSIKTILTKNAKILAANSYAIDFYSEVNAATDFLVDMGAEIIKDGFWDLKYSVTYQGKKNRFDQNEFIEFARKEAIAFLKRNKK